MVVYLIIGGILLVYLILVYLLGTFFSDPAPQWIFRISFWVLGLIGAGVFAWLHVKRSRKRKRPAEEGSLEDVDVLVKEAQSRLVSSRLGKEAKLGDLPVLYIVGEAGSTKTSIVLNSGTEPQLLAGHVYQDSAVAPTRVANLWFANGMALVEAGSAVMADSSLWGRLVRRLRPSRLRTALGKGVQAPRAALVCVSAESLLQADASQRLAASARDLREKLSDAARALGVHLPVYVLFTKMDRLPFFTEHVRNLSNEEGSEVLGVTLPLHSSRRTGVYAEEETRRLTESFQTVFFELADRRLMMLAREQQEERLPGIYEFPREFQKLKSNAVQFLVDLCRPSQLDVDPVLRGFYFTGVRPIAVTEQELASAPAALEEESEAYAAATRFFGSEHSPRPAAPAAREMRTRRIPQWVFLTHLFSKVIFQDRAALRASGFSSSTQTIRRLLLASATVLLLAAIIGTTVSYIGNRRFENRVLGAANALSAPRPAGGDLPAVETLQQLDILRSSLAEILQHREEGRPWSLRWGLYTGEKLYDDLYRVYFDRFRVLLLASAQQGLMADLGALPAEPSPAFEEGPTYDKLRAYLITTELSQCSSREVLSPVLLSRWAAGRAASEEQIQLAGRQFDFYSEMLRMADPYSTDSDSRAVANARRYLSKFTGIERLYLSMVGAASAKFNSVNFNRDVAGSEAVIINRKDVPGAFTKSGWQAVQEAIRNHGASAQGDGCDALVMGEYAVAGADLSNVEQQLSERYVLEFTDQWLSYLNATQVLGYGSARDAASKLEKISGPQSPLLTLLWLASDHTAGGPPGVAEAFQPAQYTVPPGNNGAVVAESNKGYLTDLFSLQDGWNALTRSSLGAKDTAVVESLMAATRTAKSNTNQIALNFRGDSGGRVAGAVKKILMAPIENTEALLRRLGTLDLNQQGRGLCTQISSLKNKYPFNPSASQEATLDEVAAVFHPEQGALWNLYNAHLTELLVPRGGRYQAQPGGTIRLNPRFVNFFNDAAAISRAFYPEGAADLRLVYTITPQPSGSIQQLQLTIDGQSLRSSAGGGPAQQFLWPGDSSGTKLFGMVGGATLTILNYSPGPWSVLRFFADAAVTPPSGNGVYEWRPQTSGQPLMVGNRPVIVRYGLDHGTNPPILKEGFLSTLSCVAQVSQ